MPTYENSSQLHNDETIVLQIKEGPCNAGCNYCYENAHIKSVIASAQSQGRVESFPLDHKTTLELARITKKYGEVLNAEMLIREVRSVFELIREAGIGTAALVGSEPTSHSQFPEILEAARSIGVDLTIYTAGRDLKILDHPSITRIILHLDYGQMGADEFKRRVIEKTLPTDSYMDSIIRLIKKGKRLDLRINFSEASLLETGLIINFFEKLPVNLQPSTGLKYSFSPRVAGEPDQTYFTPEKLRACSPALFRFLDDFRARFPEVYLLSERPLFPCSFDEEAWKRYSEEGGFVSSCDMEFTFYPSVGLALCPPSRSLASPQLIESAEQLRRRISDLRGLVRDLYRKPSFDECIPLARRESIFRVRGAVSAIRSMRLRRVGDLFRSSGKRLFDPFQHRTDGMWVVNVW